MFYLPGDVKAADIIIISPAVCPVRGGLVTPLDLLQWAVLQTARRTQSAQSRVFTTVLIQNNVLYKSCETKGEKKTTKKRKEKNKTKQRCPGNIRDRSLTHKRSEPGPRCRVGTGSPHMQTSSVDMLLSESQSRKPTIEM